MRILNVSLKIFAVMVAIAASGCGRYAIIPIEQKSAMEQTAAPSPTSPALQFERAGEYTLPPLPYAYDALEPVISRHTMELHHSRHHQAYVNGLNSTLRRMEEARAKGDYAAISELSQLLVFHGAGHMNHSLFWEIMAPGGLKLDENGPLMETIRRDFGSFEAFTAQFKAVANSVRGSGWAMLVWEPNGRRLIIIRVLNQEDQTIFGVTPLLSLDVWEHAYYLDYQNRRGEYVDGFMTIINWPEVERKYIKAAGIK